MLIVTFLCNTPQVHLVKSPGGARTQLTFFEDRTSRGVSYQPTRGDYFIFSKLVSFLSERTAPYRRDLRRAEYGDERDPQIRAFLERLAPLNNAASITKPLFAMQGKNDPIVPRSESDEIVNAVRKNGVPVWYFVAKDEGHGFSKKSNND